MKSIYSGAEINVKEPSLASYAGLSSKAQNNKDGKDFQIYSLTIENKRLRQENADQALQIQELKQDLEYLQQSIQNHLPMISELEVKNHQLEGQVAHQKLNTRQLNITQNKLRTLEEKYNKQEDRHHMEIVKLETEVAQYRERLDTVRAMNVNL